MSPRLRGSIRLWQTGLFIVVIVVAMLILSGTLSAGLTATLTRMAETSELRNASALAQRLEPDFPLAANATTRVRDVVAEYRGIYGGGIWVYDSDGALLESAHDAGPVEAVLQSARDAVLDGTASYAVSDLRSAGWVVASKPVNGPDGVLEGVVVTASSVDSAVAILTATRGRLWVAFWVSLAIAGLLGFGFSELIGRRIRAMSAAAAAMAAGDFAQRISPGFVPDEVEELAVSYNAMAATLGETFDAQRRFVADASHEMRTPVAALKGMLELLVDGAQDVPEVRDDFMRTMQVEVDRLGRLVSDLLTLAQLEAGSLRVAPAPESAPDLFAGVAGVLQPLAERAGVRLSVEIAEPDIRVLADRDRIVQVLLSFTDNALKHSAQGTTVHLRAERRGNAVLLEVTDEGVGIEPEDLSRVFERFYRSDAARAGGGAGLGLAIAKEIVEAHGSSIDVRSAPGVGTTFGFELPSA
ncbi:MAG: HAMP domain-containing sensor histidine kinase [Coriobacteriia bacterium]|nr:HAMP domain-containing sensor histidine kinase [Coriobacteriia bacterium]